MAEIKMACPSCGGHVEFPSDMAGQIINCPHCSLSMALQIPGGAAASVPKKSAKKTYGIGCLLLAVGAAVILFIVIPIAMVNSDADSPDSSARYAYLAARETCKSHLLAPATARFSTHKRGSENDDDAVGIPDTDTGGWRILGNVDSQNEFGALLRQEWYAEVVKPDSEHYRVIYLEIGKDIIFDHGKK